VAEERFAARRLSDAQPKANLRASQKEATRHRVLDAARTLFEDRGYEATTVREIALRAQVSVGSVFTSFQSKAEILSAVMIHRLDSLYAELDRVTPHLRGSTADRLCSMFAIHYAFESQHTRLFLAYVASAFDWTLPPEIRTFGRTPRLLQIIRDYLAAGIARGDVDPNIDQEVIVDLLCGAYAWTYHMAAWHGSDAQVMGGALNRQIALIADGFRPRLS
jgi:TetR/AcrR family transcriptional regulator, cholesterol catabolism regulator